MMLILLPLLAAAAADTSSPTPATAAPAPVTEALGTAATGTRIGLLVVDETGREIVAIRPDDRFVPASNTKLFTTAAAFAMLETEGADTAAGASVRLEPRGALRDVVLVGAGDARLSSARDCTNDCLATLVDAVARETKVVGDVIGDDTAFPDERWPAGMSWNNMVGRYGTAVSALTMDDNEVALMVRPGRAGSAPEVSGDGYYRIDNRVVTVPAGGKRSIGYMREPGSDLLRLTGTIPADASPYEVRLGVDDPAHRAAWRFAELLRSAGVRVTGKVGVRHRPVMPADDPKVRGNAPAARPPEVPALARLTPAPLREDLVHTNKVSQNLHTELLLRRVGAVSGSGSVADGHAAMDAVLERAGIQRWQYDFGDGSGMSNYNRVTPRASVRLLRWGAEQPWGAAWRGTFPIAGKDGTLANRFKGTALEGRLFAKTGTLNASNALAGYFTTATGRTFTFAAYANDMPGDVSATASLDAALVAVAAAN
ncbi:D-alanyl-D-alanine carboxypeptidase/D-alanyl-D-alanine-endopeptidase [Sphingomonas sp. IC4-52]|uniref:D-alanyl-D-alanine carboxypeptidase/D-alanyl-D-alanine endopeptidase n=1 Tax=Sphingomonas sp. IC4-52 TaxID=2887202 RepID=UPI001D1021F0|nr:D-alanyl-D-alanine carboxypeptidase/D-alanyl-D-alanine-endopeptidase [Sphingomonas sp. IC4-52]MCC2978538.1 D-alanyl-D-alanine carboxypeptidase/D-alanyl-D-alanine-endopeptidase [Sphingomonas sp. IC4-52]